jgi:hypothetical protein
MPTIFLIVPLFWFDGFRIRNHLRFIVEPALGLDGLVIRNLVRCIFIPVGRLIQSVSRF